MGWFSSHRQGRWAKFFLPMDYLHSHQNGQENGETYSPAEVFLKSGLRVRLHVRVRILSGGWGWVSGNRQA